MITAKDCVISRSPTNSWLPTVWQRDNLDIPTRGNHSTVYRNQIDYFLVQERWRSAVCNCRAYQGPDCDSDHSLVKLKFKLRLRRLQRRSATAQYEYANAGQFAVELRNRFAALAIPEGEEPGNSIQTPDTGNHSCAQISCGDGAQQKQTKMSGQSNRRWISLRDTILDTAKETLTTKRRTYSPWISWDTLAAIEAKRMCKRRSEDYPALKRTVKKMVKADRTAYFESICEEMARAELTNRSDHVYKCVERLTKQACPKTRLVRSGTGEMLTEDVSILG